MIRAKKPLEASKARLRLEEQCSRAEMCSSEAMEKMRRWGVPQPEAAIVLKELLASRFIDDARFSRSFVRDKYRFAKWGRRKIVFALKQKRICSDDILQALDEIDMAEYQEILSHVLAHKSRAMPDSGSYEAKMKLLRFAVGRGYEADLALKIIKSL